MHNIFRIAPKPKEGELIQGFLLRLAALHGFMTIKELYSAIGLVFTSYSFERTSKMYDNLLKALAPMIQWNAEALRQCFDVMTFLKTENNEASTAIKSNSPAICIGCIKDTGYIRESWQQHHLTYCVDHNCELNTHCPDCRGRFSWNADLLLGCNRCGYRWRKHQILSSTMPEYLSYFDKLDEKTEQFAFLSSLYKAFCELAQPYSFAAKKTDFNQYGNRELLEKFTLAFQLITRKKSMLLFVETVRTELAQTMQFFSCELLTKLEHPIKNIYPTFFQYEDINTPILKLENSNIFLISEVQVGLLLGISPVALSTLTTLEHLSPRYFNRTRQYDLRDIDDFMSGCSKRAEQSKINSIEGHLSLGDLDKLSSKYIMTLGEAIDAVFKSTVTVYTSDSPESLRDYYVNKYEFLALLSAEYANKKSHLVSFTELSLFFCTNHLKVSEYAKTFEWPPILVDRNSKKFDMSDVYRTLESHFFLDRWCGFKPYPKTGLDNYLQQHGFRPLRTASKQASIHVYMKSVELMKLVETYEFLWLKIESPQKVRELCKRKNIPFVPFNKKQLTTDFQLYPYPA